MKHKKLKIFAIIVLIILVGLLFLGNCKKTNAYDIYEPIIDTTHYIRQNQAFAIIYNYDDLNVYYLSLYNANTLTYYVDYGSNNIRLRRSDGQVLGYLPAPNNFKGYLYIQFCVDYEERELYLFMDFINYTIINRQDESPLLTDFSINTGGLYVPLNDNDFLNNYFSSQTDIRYKINYNDTYLYRGLIYKCEFNVPENFSQEKDEQVELLFETIKINIPKNNLNYLIDNFYRDGYQAGYNTGYLQGQTEGYNRGFSEGYAEGYQDGQEDTQLYQNGYQAGYSVGYSEGEMSTDAYNIGYNRGYEEGNTVGYQNGYQEGYNTGYEQGQTGENPITPAFSIISSIFGAIGSILAIQLVPGVPLGLFILVPLFFSALGLILWIWRRN